MPNGGVNGWTEWGRHVLSEIERINGCIETINSQLRQFAIEQTILKVKAGVWGAVAGCIPVLLALLVMAFGGYIKSPPKTEHPAHTKLENQIKQLSEENKKLREEIRRNTPSRAVNPDAP